MIKGDKMWVLMEYNFVPCEVLSVGPKRVKVRAKVPFCNEGEYRVDPEKLAATDEKVCIVWELWKGGNGRGAYRIERKLYPDKHYLPLDHPNTYDYVYEDTKPEI
jgi:hypothetical protein